MDTVPTMEMTVEQFEQLLEALGSRQGSHDAILLFAGIAAFAGILFVLWWVLNLKLAPLEKSNSRLETALEKSNSNTEAAVKEINEKISEIQKSLWTPTILKNEIKLEVQEQIKEHIQNCPYKDQCKQS